jgi:hypothetical protein
MADNPIWKRLPTDTDKSFEAFALYRDMGANRSLKTLSQKLAKSLPFLKEWSSKHDWVNRVAAFDASLDEKNLDKNAERQERIKDNAYSDYLLTRKAIEKYKADYEAVNFKGVPAYEMSNLLELMRRADDYARRAVGLPDKITESKNTNDNRHSGSVTLLSELSDDELDKLLED